MMRLYFSKVYFYEVYFCEVYPVWTHLLSFASLFSIQLLESPIPNPQFEFTGEFWHNILVELRLHLNSAGCTFLNTFGAHRHSSVLIWQQWKLWPPICAANHSEPLPKQALSLVEMPGLRAVLPDFLSKHWEWAPPCSLKCRLARLGQSRYLCPFSPAWSHPGVRRENLRGANSAHTFQDWG